MNDQPTATCPSSISDGIETVTCVLKPEHNDDHGRGFLRWVNETFWYTRRQRAEDGSWHALPYPEPEDPV